MPRRAGRERHKGMAGPHHHPSHSCTTTSRVVSAPEPTDQACTLGYLSDGHPWRPVREVRLPTIRHHKKIPGDVISCRVSPVYAVKDVPLCAQRCYIIAVSPNPVPCSSLSALPRGPLGTTEEKRWCVGSRGQGLRRLHGWKGRGLGEKME